MTASSETRFGTMLTKYGTHVVTRRDVRHVGRVRHSLLRLASREHFAYRFEAMPAGARTAARDGRELRFLRQKRMTAFRVPR